MTLIDLDRPAPEPEAARRQPSRRRRIAGTVALMLVAAALGGFAAFRWQQQRSRSTVQVVVLADLAPAGGSGGQDGRTPVVSHVDVVNAGPAPVRMVAVNVAVLGMKPGAWNSMDKLIAPGQVAILTFLASVDCGNNSLLTAVPATVEVVSAGGAHRRVAVTVDAAAWAEQVARTCPKR